jgi:acyl transferase domain-containing protein
MNKQETSVEEQGYDEGMESSLEPIAIIGWNGRFPGADNIEDFWENIRKGEESIVFYSDEELRQAGVGETHIQDANIVKAGATIDNAEMFDASFFGFTPREARLMDPQHRVFLESCWHALEDAGIDTNRCDASIGVFAGTNLDNYLFAYFNEKEFTTASPFDKRLSSDNGFLATRVAYKLNLKGPAITIQTACSTSLVATSVACQHLMTYQCDVALAGGSTVQAPRKTGYIYQPHGISSPDGHCRPFDQQAQGTIGGEGVATVVLKRLEDALSDGDTIHGVIKGWALNNDGDAKVGFTAPSVDGQAEVIEMAQALAGVTADTIGYIEAHGTGTELGDPIEVAALTQAFSATTENRNFCALGSIKANIGHLDAAAGVAGLIKATLALKHKQIPPLVHYQQANPKINLQKSPFYINTQLQDWEKRGTPRRAGISSFGMGGTNAHIILEENTDAPLSGGSSRSHQLLQVSARNKAQCEQALKNLAAWLEQHPEQSLADIAYTLQTGRRQFSYTASCVADCHTDAIDALQQADSTRVSKAELPTAQVEIAFMFPGQGNQYISMGEDLYRDEELFREVIDQCCDKLNAEFAYDLREIIYPAQDQDETAAAEKLMRTEYAQPALFVIEYAMAKLLISWGIQPQALIGHSIGEYVAATLAGVFTLDAALTLVAHRGRLMQSVKTGSMAAIPLSADKLSESLPADLSIAVINEPGMCVVSGVSASVDTFVESCEKENMRCYPLHTSHAFHSVMMDEILDDFSALLMTVDFSAPQIPFLSNVTGDWITEQQAMDATYWVSHIRQAVQFNAGMQTLLVQPSRLLFEVGPGNSLSSIAQRHPDRSDQQRVMNSMRHLREARNDLDLLLENIGKVCSAGVGVDWSAFYQNENRLKVPLPGYPFERKAFWIQHSARQVKQFTAQAKTYEKLSNISDWFYVPSWQRQPAISALVAGGKTTGQQPVAKKCWLVFVDASGLANRLITALQQQGDSVISVNYGDSYAVESEPVQPAVNYTVSACEADIVRLLQDLRKHPQLIDGVVYPWLYGGKNLAEGCEESLLETSFYLPLFLVKAVSLYLETLPKDKASKDFLMNIWFVSSDMQQVTGDEIISPLKSLLLGVNKVTPFEIFQLQTRSIDFTKAGSVEANAAEVDSYVELLLAELNQVDQLDKAENEIAYRGLYRWLKTVEPMPLKSTRQTAQHGSQRLKKNGIYLITGGLGGIGRTLAGYLAEHYQAGLLLVGRSALPDVQTWDGWLAEHEDENATSRKICFIRDLEEKGAKVINIACDVADAATMKTAIAKATAELGDINGVIHSAGVPGGGLIQLKDRESAAKILAAKVQGAMVLDALFDKNTLDFMLLCSSLAAVSSGIGQVDYTAANIYLDALATRRQQRGLYTVSVNWDTWAEVGMAVDTEVPAEYRAQKQQDLDAGIRAEEGIEVFNWVLSQQSPQIITSTRANLQCSANAAKNISVEIAPVPDDRGHVAVTAVTSQNEIQTETSATATDENYKAPGSETETMLCDIWQEMFGIERISVEDSFFDLGGHSLLAVQILSRVNAVIEDHVSLNDFFDAVTIAALAAHIDHNDTAADTDSVEVTDELVDSLSDEEVARMLAEKGIELDD